MRAILRRIKHFFLPPPETPTWKRILPYAILGMLTMVFLTAFAYTWEYTNSPQFCGETCHTMPPEYTAYLTSPHARVDCVDCHIGKGFIAERITRKAGDVKHIVSLAFKRYEFPIRADELRPARETCEKCHFPEKFSDDSLRRLHQFDNDQDNSASTIYLVMKTGGGTSRLGQGKGIHWHIENPVYYFPTDAEEQEIPYIEVPYDDGSTTAYLDIESGFDPASLGAEDLVEMDCITCHNRITHLVKQPENIIDQLLSLGVISPGIPEIRRVGVEMMRREYESKEQALLGISRIEAYYKSVYPEFYAENQDQIQEAVVALQEAYDRSVYPQQKSDWDSHPNNVGHEFSPGCFRCHDGKHLNTEQEAVRLECNLCHSIPVVSAESDFVAEIEISRGPEPQSHFNPNWISLHNQVFNESCANCHSMQDPGGTSDSSFCSNSACHGRAWDYAGFDAPALREILLEQASILLPTPEPQAATPDPAPEVSPQPEAATAEPEALTFTQTIGPLLAAKCSACHGQGGQKGLNLTTYAGVMDGGESGAAIVPGDPDSSLLVQIQSAQPAHFGQFTSSELDQVVEWIAIGAPE
jgi:nitrate/TMAO reductase-like tetraheme cytochrome c subunit